MRKLRIVFAMYRPGLSGGTRISCGYIERLRARGHEVTVVCLRPRELSLWGRALDKLGLSRTIDPARDSPFLARSGARVIAVLGDEPQPSQFPDADVVIATFWPTAHWIHPLGPEKGRKLYFVQHHELHRDAERALVEATYRMPLRKLAVSGWLKDIMRERYGDPDVTVIHNAIDLEQFRYVPRTKNQVPTVGFMYSSAAFKATPLAVEAIARVKGELPGLRVVAFGSSDPTPENPLPEGTEFYCKPEQALIPELYRRCDVWICSSHLEGFALPPVEAMATGTPAVSTRVGAMPDLIVDGSNGYLVEPGDVATLSARVLDVLGLSGEAWSQMSVKAREAGAAQTWDSATDQFEAELYRALD